ncbi:hypothetical protein HH212_16990 [Massilia forsythiae]|uniref:Helicase ATP-binding domain-containing protein n=1 Tax=Massilia forsythiae TaxID=2728020 RepID=A0A7Z2ZUX9_9BURK|nr:hypothetical protein [Massilia forsythiae]QJE01512.1 hypothetical protein HH212_16990 [Massilia forsythiae]
MQTLMAKCTALALSITARYIAKQPTFADAAAISAGRLRLWSGWAQLPHDDMLVIARFLRYRPDELAQPNAFMQEAQLLIDTPLAWFELVTHAHAGHVTIHETDRYRIAAPLDPDRLIRELLGDVMHWKSDRRVGGMNESGDIVLKQFTSERTRVFSIPDDMRSYLSSRSSLPLDDAPGTGPVRWNARDLEQIAIVLDAADELHNSHVSSLKHLLGRSLAIETEPGAFYRVNAPTGAGKSVVMLLMALDAARRGLKMTIAVPHLLDVRHMASALHASAQALGLATTVAPLHSQSRIPEMAENHFVDRVHQHPYHYACLLDAFSSDDSWSQPGLEPCFTLHLSTATARGGERTKRLETCPLLPRCGMVHMLAQAIEADIVVVNHHALLAGTTRIPIAGGPAEPAPLHTVELLLRKSQVFLVDEIDGLLQSAISSSVFELELGSRQTTTLLGKLRHEVEFPATPIHDMKPSNIIRASWALTYCTLTVNELLDLHRAGHFEWPKKETTWPTADDGVLTDKLQLSRELLDDLFDQRKLVPSALRGLQGNLAYWARNDGTRAPEAMARELQVLIDELAAASRLAKGTKPKEHEKLKASLLLRGRLAFLEQQLRDLQHDLPALIRANVDHAREVQQSLKGAEPVSPTPNGPLHRTVYGFKRKESDAGESTLHVVAMRGDPHGTLLALPQLTALAYAGVERIFVGFSATAYFPGASNFDLPATDLVDVPDSPGHINFEHVGTTVAVSGAPMQQRASRVRSLAIELWPWLDARLAHLRSSPVTAQRARLLLVTNSDDDAEELAAALFALPEGPGRDVLLVRSSGTDVGAQRLPRDQKMAFAELASFATGPHAGATILVSSIFPMARGHNIVNTNGESAIGGIVVCVRPLPSSDRPGNNLAHVCYETGNTVLPSEAPGEAMLEERKRANALLYTIRNSSPAFSQQPANIRHYTVMNILVTLTQLLGRARRGGTAVTCYLADAAFYDSKTTWADLLDETVRILRTSGKWPQFARHHAALATALVNYIATHKPEAA